MDQIREENSEAMILELFREKDTLMVVLTGRTGIGKTWMARRVSLLALKDGLFDIALWVHMGVKQSQISLYENLAHQLSLRSTSGEIELDDKELDIDVVDVKEDLVGLKNEILTRVLQQRLLLILDDEGKTMNVDNEEIQELLHFFSGNLTKVMITSINEDGRHKSEGSNIIIDLKPPEPQKALSMFQDKAANVFAIPNAKLVIEEFINQHIGLTPSEIIIIARTLNYYQRESTSEGLARALEEVHHSHTKKAIPLTYHDHNRLPGGVLLEFTFQDSHLIRERVAVHYKDLIAYWIMEGYLGDIDHLEDAYLKGHSIILELLDLQVLKKVDANYFVLENLDLNLKDHFRRGLGGTANLGLGKIFGDSYQWRGFGELALADGSIKTISSERKDWRQFTLLLDGNSLSQKEPSSFLLSNEELQIVVFFALRFNYLPYSLSGKSKLNVLVLRGCNYLEKVVEIKRFKALTVLEISGAKSLRSMPDDIFLELTMLRSLNLSNLQIEVLPTSIYDLTELQWVILKGCSNLKRLKSLKRWKKLEVLDLSGATSFKQFAVSSMKASAKLQFLDLSYTKISLLPFLRENRQLTYLSLSGCQNLSRLPSIESLSKLQVLDLAGANIKEFQDKSFLKNDSLRILDLSGTVVSSLPFKINTHYLYMKACSKVETIKCLELSEKLELLDCSGATSLVNFEGKSLEHIKHLSVLNLSDTKITCLPSLSNLQNLRQLLLSHCVNLVKLPALNSLTKLEVLDLSGCKALTVLEDKNFRNLSRLTRLSLSETKINELPELPSLSNLEELNLCGVSLLANADFLEYSRKLRVLDLSETSIKKFPSLSCFESLTNLSLRNCVKIETLDNLENFTKLEVLDLSGTSIKQLPSLRNLTSLHELLLKDCFSLKELADMQDLYLLGEDRPDLPYGISELTNLEHLALPKTNKLEESDRSQRACSIEKINEPQWEICRLSKKLKDPNRPLVSLTGLAFLELLNEDDSALETHFKDFHYVAHPIHSQSGTGGIYFHEDEYVFRDVYFKLKHISYLEEQLDLLEIHGFQNFPKGVECVVSHAKYIFFLDNSFMTSFSDLDLSELKRLKGCWIERCQNMDSLVHTDRVADFIELGKSLEVLCVSYALDLKSLFIEKLREECFQRLKHLHLDCCPGLPSVFHSSSYPQNLETLHIKFCDGMETLFEDDSKDHVFPNLHSLHLLEMENLIRIGCAAPSLHFLEVERCPMLEQILSTTTISESLQIVKVKYCKNLQNLLDGEKQVNQKVPSQLRLQLWDLPELISSGIDLVSLPASSIRDCPKLQIPVP